MKKLSLVLCGWLALCGCGGGGGGGGGTPAPSTLFVSISPSAQTSIEQGQSVQFTATVANDSSGSGVSWKISGPELTGTSGGTLTNVTTSAATYNALPFVSTILSVTITATSVANTSQSGSAVVVVYPPLSITTTALPNATPNANYAAVLQASGGAGGLSWSLASGALPIGLSLSKSGAITGDPTVPGPGR